MQVAFAMGALGALLGVWIAWSQSPVVVTVLPLLFGVIGGAGGYSLLKMDFSKPHNKEKLHLIGLGLGTLCLSCLIFMVAAIISRPFLADLIAPDDVDVTASASPFRLVMMRARLQALGATGKEIKFILKPPISRISDSDQIVILAKDADEFVKTYDSISEPDKAALETDFSDLNPGTLANRCRVFLTEKEALSSGGKSLDNYQSALLITRFATVALEARTGNPENERQKTLVKHPMLIATRIKLIRDLQAIRRITEAGTSSREIEEADKVLLPILAKAPKSAGKTVEIGGMLDSPSAR